MSLSGFFSMCPPLSLLRLGYMRLDLSLYTSESVLSFFTCLGMKMIFDRVHKLGMCPEAKLLLIIFNRNGEGSTPTSTSDIFKASFDWLISQEYLSDIFWTFVLVGTKPPWSRARTIPSTPKDVNVVNCFIAYLRRSSEWDFAKPST